MARSEIPIFPLGNVALFPTASAPLHIFEPRYREMTAAALAGDRRIGMVTVRPEHQHEMAGDPPIYEVGCAGFVAQHQQLADGRYHLLLRGVERFRVLHEVPREGSRLYRVAQVEGLPEQLGDTDRAERLRREVIAQLRRVAEHTLGGEAPAVDDERLVRLELGRFADAVAQALSLPAREKQGLLEAETVEARLERLEAALAFHLALVTQGATGGPQTIH